RQQRRQAGVFPRVPGAARLARPTARGPERQAPAVASAAPTRRARPWSPVALRAGAVDQAPLCWLGRCPQGIRPLSRSLVLARREARGLARSAARERVDRLGGWPLGGIAIASSVPVRPPRVRRVDTRTVLSADRRTR